MNREDVLNAVLSARTREEVAQAQKMRNEWVKLHPDDDEIFDASESLEMLAQAQALIDAEKNS
ncbi:hypothetical protein EON83_28385 [bacterium]|nr:MAG: hypothetical protein EON83_28385 [bacterium]